VGFETGDGVDSASGFSRKGRLWPLFVAQAAGCVSRPLRWRTSLCAPSAVGLLSGSPALSALSASACSGRRTFLTRCPRQSPCRSRLPSRAERDLDRPAHRISRGGAISAPRTRRPRRCLASRTATTPSLPRCCRGCASRAASELATGGAISGGGAAGRKVALGLGPRSGRRAMKWDRRQVAKTGEWRMHEHRVSSWRAKRHADVSRFRSRGRGRATRCP